MTAEAKLLALALCASNLSRALTDCADFLKDRFRDQDSEDGWSDPDARDAWAAAKWAAAIVATQDLAEWAAA